jgi:hypothetical protein
METFSSLVASMPSGQAYVRLKRHGATFVGGPYPTADLACQSAGRLFVDVPEVTSIAIVARPEVAAPSPHQRWYARAILRSDGYTAVAGPFGSRRRARSALMALADRGQIGGWHDWAIDYHEIGDPRVSWPAPRMRGRARWHRTSTPLPPSRPDARSDSTGPAPAAGRWARNGEQIARWIALGGYPDTPREDLLRDVVMLWDEWPADAAAWDALGALLATMAAASPAVDREADGITGALVELAAAIEHRAASAPGAADDFRRLVGALVGERRDPRG